jgi:hypothetical protein
MVAPRLMLPHWLRYQVKRTKLAYLPAYRRSNSRKSFGRSCFEAVLLAAWWRCLPFHYLRYGLYEREHSLKDVFGYLPETVFYYRLLSHVNRDVVLLDDKLVCKRVLGDADVPQAALLASGDEQNCLDAKGELVLENGLDDFLEDRQRVVVKPARYSSGGDGVMVLTHKTGTLYDEHQTGVSLSEYGATWGAWLLEEFVSQHHELAALNERSLNTFRVITTWRQEHGARVEHCILKLGSSTGLVDNAHDGGLYLRVDPDTGELDEMAFDETFTRHPQHPVSGVVFKGYRVSMMREIVALAERSASLFSQITVIGWDIAVAEDGPLVVEGNSSPGLTNVQRTHGGVAHTLGRYLADACNFQRT